MAYKGSAGKTFTAQLRLAAGGVTSSTLSGAVTLDGQSSNFLQYDPGGSSRNVTFPAESDYANGFFFVANAASDAGELLVLKDDAAVTKLSLDKGEVGLMFCDGTAWYGVALQRAGTITADVISELTAAAGVTIDGLRIKDAAVTPVAGGAAWADLSNCATGEADIIVGANLADAFTIRSSSLSYLRLATTTASPGLVGTFAHTGTAAGFTLTETINHATQVGGGFDSDVTQLTTARTGGYAYAYRAKTTSLAGDLNGVPYTGLYVLAPTDGGGAVLHSGMWVATGNDYSVHGQDNVRTAWGTGAAGVADATMGWDATILSLLPAVDDSVFKIGDGTLNFDVWMYGATASDYMLVDASASTVSMNGAMSIRGIRTSSATAGAITGATVLTLADSGGVFSVSQAAAYDIDLPSPTTGAGCRYTFYLTGAAANNVTITVLGGAATFVGTIVNDVTSVLPATGSTLTFASGVSALGDNIEITSISTGLYLVRAVSSANGGITIA